MFCPNCGTPIPEAHQACPSCGTPTPQNLKQEPAAPQPHTYCRACGTPIPAGQPACANCGTAVVQQSTPAAYSQQSYPQQPYPQQPYAPQKPMGWFKFLIYFSLWAGAILNIISGLSTFISVVTYSTYSLFPGQIAVDVIYGIVCILLGVYTIVTRFQLARFRKNAPMMLHSIYILSIAFSVIYLIATSAVTMIPLSQFLNAQMIGSFGGSIAMIVINVIYFGKRSDMFVR